MSLIWRFDAEGRPTRRIRLNDGVELLGVTDGQTFWAFHTDDLGIQRIRLYVVSFDR